LRLVLAMFALVLAVSARGADILVLIRQSEAGPLLHEGMYREPTWVLWPVADDPVQFNRMLALASGVDWQSDMLGGDFDGRPSPGMANVWRRLGFFEATKNNVGARRVYAVQPSNRPTDVFALAAAWRDAEVHEVGQSDPWPVQSVVVAMAGGPNPWDEVAKLIKKAGGRALVVEVPDSKETYWTRIWLKGRGWPDGVPKVRSTSLPGLIEAKDALGILVEPERARWDEPLRDPPNFWLGFGHRAAPVTLVFLAVAGVYVLGLAVLMALREQYSRTALVLLRLLVLGPAAIVLGGRLASSGGLSNWAPLLAAAFAILFVLAWLTNKAIGHWVTDSHPLWGEFAVGLLAVAGIDPTWSMFSSVLGEHRAPISPEAFGALASYAVGANYLFSNKQIARIVWGLVAISMTLDLLLMSRWASPIYVGVVPLTIAACYRPLVAKLKIWLPAMVVVGLVGAFLWPGLVYAPDHLVHSYSQVGKFNCDEQLAFLMSPMFVCFTIVALVVGIAGGNFLGHQIRRAMAFSPPSKAYFFAAVGFGVAGIFIPLYLHAALATSIAGAVVVLFDAVRVP